MHVAVTDSIRGNDTSMVFVRSRSYNKTYMSRICSEDGDIERALMVFNKVIWGGFKVHSNGINKNVFKLNGTYTRLIKFSIHIQMISYQTKTYKNHILIQLDFTSLYLCANIK